MSHAKAPRAIHDAADHAGGRDRRGQPRLSPTVRPDRHTARHLLARAHPPGRAPRRAAQPGLDPTLLARFRRVRLVGPHRVVRCGGSIPRDRRRILRPRHGRRAGAISPGRLRSAHGPRAVASGAGRGPADYPSSVRLPGGRNAGAATFPAPRPIAAEVPAYRVSRKGRIIVEPDNRAHGAQAMRMPRMTTRRWMVAMVGVAVMTWMAVTAYRIEHDAQHSWLHHIWAVKAPPGLSYPPSIGTFCR